MKRAKPAGARAKARRSHAAKPLRSKVRKAAPRPRSTPSGDGAEIARLARELSEAREEQTATGDVLRIISSSPGNLDPVFTAVLGNAIRICDAAFGGIYQWDGEMMRMVATHNLPPAFAKVSRHRPFHPRPNSLIASIVVQKKLFHTADGRVERLYIDRTDPAVVAAIELGGARTFLAVPLLKQHELIGILHLNRTEIRRFTEKQIELVKSFAAQAVIAIENARLLNELRQSLEQQTATANVLKVISSSPGALEPAFNALLENATKLCGASLGNLVLCEGRAFRSVAMYGELAGSLVERVRAGALLKPEPDFPLVRAAETKQPFQYPDVRQAPSYLAGHPLVHVVVHDAGILAMLAVPMLKEGEVVGAIVIYAKEARPFTERQIELLENFAAQAVIAIENSRLLNELRERTKEVEELNKHLEHRVADQVGEIERIGRLRRFLPPQVADLIVASGTEKQLESHRREITALFCDLRGFTGFTESADAEDVMALLRDYHAAIGQIVVKYNGTLERYAGDGVMVIFNDPVPVENPALQAVLMALEVRGAIGRLTETWRRWGHDIGFGIGIAHGFATLGTIGFEGRFDYAAIGTVSNVASRLCDEAKPGQILISPRVLTKVEHAVDLKQVGEFELKGIRRPMAAYNVIAAKPMN
jgi:class 3 adenylate cyclase/putative methionine-R-sulfoxide reductase with GAF domain